MAKGENIILCISFVCMHLLPTCSAGVVKVEENGVATLMYPYGDLDYINREWRYGYENVSSNSRTVRTLLFIQSRNNTVLNFTDRADMSVDPTTFALTINRVQLKDDGYFTCRILEGTTLRLLSSQIKVEVYISPKLTFSGLEQAPYKENETVTVTCRVARLYPQIQPESFTMTWGDTVTEAEGEKNKDPDESYRYRVGMRKTLTKEDHGVTVTCNVNPVRGTPVTKERNLNVQYLTDAPPTSSNTPPAWPAVIGGILGCLLISFVIVIGVICYKRKQRPTEPDQHGAGRDAVNNHQINQRNLPDVPSDGYLEIVEPGYPVATARRTSDQMDVSVKDHQYEILHFTPKSFDDWIKQNSISRVTHNRLRKHAISTIPDLKALTKSDILELGINIGDRNRLKIALKTLR